MPRWPLRSACKTQFAMAEEETPKEDPFAERDGESEACAVLEVVIRKAWTQVLE